MRAAATLWEFLGLTKSQDWQKRPRGEWAAAETETVRKIVEALGQMEPERARYIAAFAYLLSRVARADLKISPEEELEMERIVSERGGLSKEQAALVVQIARNQNRLFGATENFLVGREFDRIATRAQKIALLHCLYAVSSADKSISATEDHEIREIARELKLDHSDYIDVRLAFREYLSVLKNPPGSES
ncbi:MAG: TerB family tellurite resistance protein [Acidobacteriia bacterium]|nr:TerB family tellurite resistance protein [Terriglobia bacterium]